MDDLIFINRNDQEYRIAWQRLSENWLNQELDNPTVARSERSGEAWEYMGTELHEDGWYHCFRHRDHPKTLNREYVLVQVSDGWNPKLSLDASRLLTALVGNGPMN